MQIIAENKSFGGRQLRVQHDARTTQCEMIFSIFLPPQIEQQKVPWLLWLSGLTCNDQNFVTKAGAQAYAAQHGIAIVVPDTSPRGEGVPDDAEGEWDFGLGAGFYVDATQAPWNKNYQMYSYIVDELFALVVSEFDLLKDRVSVSGHSMGGHGALTIAFKNSGVFRSVSAFAPIVAPMKCGWGEKAFSHYLGSDKSNWADHDSCALIASTTERLPLLIDQGSDDDVLDTHLKPQLLEQAADNVDYPIDLRYQQGYDHSYFFVASFMQDHLNFHAKHLFS